MNRPARRLVRLLGVLLALLLLQLLVTLPFPWEGIGPLDAVCRPNPDLLLILGLGLALTLRSGVRGIVVHGLAVLTLFVPLYRFGITVVPTFYGKVFQPYEDILLVPGLAHLLIHTYPGWVQIVLLVAFALVVLLIHWLIACLLRVCFGALTARGGLIVLLVGCQLLFLFAWAQKSAGVPAERRLWSESVLGRAFEDLSGLPRFVRSYRQFLDHMEQNRERIASLPDDLGRLQGADVYVLFIESYGRAAFRKADLLARFRTGVEPLEAELDGAGFHVVTSYLHPSVIGGGSGLAHAELLTGEPISNRVMFETVLDSSLKALPRFFLDAGYRTYNVQPAMTVDWPEGSFFGFSDFVFQAALPYSGRTYHWGLMPDQAALARVLDSVVRPAEQPLFLMYVSVTSHAPFNMIPPYYEDWSKALEPGAFSEPPAIEYDLDWTTYLTDPRIEKAYIESLLYSLQVATGFASRLERPSLLFVLGDHQPPSVGELTRLDPSAMVPLHVLSNRPELLAPYYQLGFRLGLTPPQDAEAYPSSEFLPAFLNLYGEGR